MLKFKKVFLSAIFDLKKWSVNPRIYVVMLALGMVVNVYVTPFSQAAELLNVPLSTWVFPYLTCNSYFILLLMLGIVFLFCDAPFFDDQQQNILIRSGKTAWLWGQFLYIIIASAIYILAAMLFSIIWISGDIDFTLEWGKALGTLSQTHLSDLSVPYKIQLNFSPIGAMLFSFLLCWLVAIFLGVVMFVLNLYTHKVVGIGISTLFIILIFFARNSAFSVTYFSPVSWASMDIVDTTNITQYPSAQYCILCLTISTLILFLIAVIFFKKKDVNFTKTL